MTFDELKTRIEAPDAGGSDSEALTSAVMAMLSSYEQASARERVTLEKIFAEVGRCYCCGEEERARAFAGKAEDCRRRIAAMDAHCEEMRGLIAFRAFSCGRYAYSPSGSTTKIFISCKFLADGAVEFLDYLKAHNIPRTIATMSEKVNVDFFIEGFHLARWFDLEKIVYDNGKIPGKPAPDIYEIAAKNLNLAPSECIVVEDAVSGIAAAKNAGIGKIIAIGPREKHDFLMSLEGVTETITNFYEFNREVLYENN